MIAVLKAALNLTQIDIDSIGLQELYEQIEKKGQKENTYLK